MNIKDVIVITNTEYCVDFQKFLKDGSQWGINITILPQAEPKGIAEAFLIAEEEIKGHDVALMLGDNMFYGYNKFPQDIENFKERGLGCSIYSYEVKDPERYGVIEYDKDNNVISIEEKPEFPKSNSAAVGLYLMDKTVVERTKKLKPSARGELEITDVMLSYLKDDQLDTIGLHRGVVWLDAGTVTSLSEASNYVEAIENRSGVKVACPEETALEYGYITLDKFKEVLDSIPNCDYKNYLKDIYARKIKNIS